MTASELIGMKSRFAHMLAVPSELRTDVVRYMTYRTIEENPRITVGRLRMLLAEYVIDKDTLNSAISSLIARTLFNAVAQVKAPGDNNADNVKLLTRRNAPTDFRLWLDSFVSANPEVVSVFSPPVFVFKRSDEKSSDELH